MISKLIYKNELDRLLDCEKEVHLQNPWTLTQPVPVLVKDILRQLIFDYGEKAPITQRLIDILRVVLIDYYGQSEINELSYIYFSEPKNKLGVK